jgi:hypothetical protein
MAESVANITVSLPGEVQPILDSLAGITLNQKIAHLLLGEVRRNLETSEQERLELEVKYGMEYETFQQQLESGALGNVFDYDLEIDALRWSDLIAEKRHWLEQVRALRDIDL